MLTRSQSSGKSPRSKSRPFVISWLSGLLGILIVAAVAVCYVISRAVDGALNTRFRRALAGMAHDVSRDQLSVLRKAQIKYLFGHDYGLKHVNVTLAGGSYWMSIPCIIEGTDRRTKTTRKYMGKIINDASFLKHRYMTLMRNLGVMASGAHISFDEHTSAKEMVEYERDSMMKLKNRSVKVPELYGMHRLNDEDYMLVMEYIEGRPLSRVELTGDVLDQVFAALKTMHDSGVFHGDVKLDNFLYSNGDIVVVDCLKVNGSDTVMAQDFDLICAICALAQKVPADMVIEHARKYHTEEELKRSCRLIGVALNKVDLDLSMDAIKTILDDLGEKGAKDADNTASGTLFAYKTRVKYYG